MEVSADQLKQAVEDQHGGKALLVDAFYAMLHLGGIRSPLDAVRVAIVAERKQRG